MLKPWKIINAAGTRVKLDDLASAIHREAEGAEPDPFDDAMMAAVVGVAEAMKAEGWRGAVGRRGLGWGKAAGE